MSENSTIVCVTGIINNNIQMAAKLISDFQELKLITHELSDCVLGGLGYGRLDNYHTVVYNPDETEHLSLNGVRILLNPSCYCSMELNPELIVRCPECNQDQLGEISVAEYYMESLSEEKLKVFECVRSALDQYNGCPRKLTCNHCGSRNDITQYGYEGNLCFSNLALEFFNWGELSQDFLESIEARVGKRICKFTMHY